MVRELGPRTSYRCPISTNGAKSTQGTSVRTHDSAQARNPLVRAWEASPTDSKAAGVVVGFCRVVSLTAAIRNRPSNALSVVAGVALSPVGSFARSLMIL